MNVQELIDTASMLVTGDNGQLLLDVDITINNERIAADFGSFLQQASGAAKRERFLVATRVASQIELGLDAASRAGSAKKEAL